MTRLTLPLRDRLERAWRRTDELFALLHPDALHRRPIALRHPFIFYLGHLPAFGWNQVGRALLAEPGVRPDFDDLFQRGIDPPDTPTATAAAATAAHVASGTAAGAGEGAGAGAGAGARAAGASLVAEAGSWPSVPEILAYRDAVRDRLRAAFETVPERQLHRDHVMARGGRAFATVLEHELMHHETLLYMVRELEPALKAAPAARAGPSLVPGAVRRDVAIPAGRALLGARFEHEAFGWDNEFPQLAVDVPAFVIDSTPVTNADFEEFVRDGGYEDPALWTAEGWQWQRARGTRHPQCWVERDGERHYRGLFEELPLRRVFDWPVSVAWVEAAAYARWRGARLPTEAEYHRAAYGAPDGSLRRHPWGEATPAPRHGNFDLEHWGPTPVGSHPDGASAFGVHELVGNGWEWTSSLFLPFPGFQPYMPDYRGYSADFFDGRHYVLLGGSWATDADLLRRSFRNWFQPHYPYVFSKFRCVRDA
jgi:ergothioneine biosynthesis protein EgtB